MRTIEETRLGPAHDEHGASRVEYIFGWWTKPYEDGRRAPKFFRLVVHGNPTRWMRWTREDRRHPERRLKEEMARVRFCALCRKPIYPGESLVEYTPMTPEMRDVVESLRASGRAPIVVGGGQVWGAMGCTRMGCCPGIDTVVARWTGEGVVPHRPDRF